jgi:hypothetical protein
MQAACVPTAHLHFMQFETYGTPAGSPRVATSTRHAMMGYRPTMGSRTIIYGMIVPKLPGSSRGRYVIDDHL